MEYISLGSNCSITYQLNKFGLRTHAYPFDWSKISLCRLIDVLVNNFIDFSESIEFKKISSNHPLLDSNEQNYNESSLIVYNKYNIVFAHELSLKYDLEEFRSKMKIRIERFLNMMSNPNKIKFIRIEQNKIKSNFYANIIKLYELLNKITLNFDLIIIICSQDEFIFPSNIHIVRFESFDSDWKMDNSVCWKQIFNL
jgi:hypothetical protein